MAEGEKLHLCITSAIEALQKAAVEGMEEHAPGNASNSVIDASRAAGDRASKRAGEESE